ncbi:hypothetical protein BG004_000367, partial [Podila humilis]
MEMSTTIPRVINNRTKSIEYATYYGWHLIFRSRRDKHVDATPEELDWFSEFCTSLIEYLDLSPSVVIVALYYLARVINIMEAKEVNGLGQRGAASFFTVAAILAEKFVQDPCASHIVQDWAYFSGRPVEELCRNEIKVLTLMGHNLYISSKKYMEWQLFLERFLHSPTPIDAGHLIGDTTTSTNTSTTTTDSSPSTTTIPSATSPGVKRARDALDT